MPQVFPCAGGITLAGLTNSHGLLIDIQLAMMRGAARVIVCLDYTKFGRRSVSPLSGLERIHTMVTDAAAPADLLAGRRQKGIQVVVAGDNSPAQPAAAMLHAFGSAAAPATTPSAPRGLGMAPTDVSWD